MARETKAQREAREAAERQEAWDRFREEYPQRFAEVLFEYTRLTVSCEQAGGCPYQVVQMDSETYRFVHGWSDYALKVTVPVNQNWEALYALESIERDVQDYYDEVAEVERRDTVKRDALAKLNDEERELLGL